MQTKSPGRTPLGNEQAFMVSFREGNKEAFTVVRETMIRPLLYFVESIIRSPVDAEDIVANAFYKLFHARENMHCLEHIKRWLFVIVRNESIDYLRARAKQKQSRSDLSYLETGIEELAETERVRTMLLQDINNAIGHLPKQRKTILTLYFFGKKTTSEIANIMRLSPQTVLNHKAKALEALRKSILLQKWLANGIPGFLFAAAICLLH